MAKRNKDLMDYFNDYWAEYLRLCSANSVGGRSFGSKKFKNQVRYNIFLEFLSEKAYPNTSKMRLQARLIEKFLKLVGYKYVDTLQKDYRTVVDLVDELAGVKKVKGKFVY